MPLPPLRTLNLTLNPDPKSPDVLDPQAEAAQTAGDSLMSAQTRLAAIEAENNKLIRAHEEAQERLLPQGMKSTQVIPTPSLSSIL